MKKLIILLTFYLISLSSCYAARIDGPYEGKVIDAETGQPIEGVVVLGVWNTVTVTPGGGTHRFHDTQETLTDKNGDFKIKGLGLKVLSNVEPMNVLIFKAGYQDIGCGPWKSLKEGLIYSETVKWEGDKAIIPLKKLTMEERRKRGTISRPSIPIEKMKLLTEEINKDRTERGLDPL